MCRRTFRSSSWSGVFCFTTCPFRWGKRQQKAQKCPGYLKKNQSVQSEVTALAVLTATPHPESHAKPKCKVNLPHELTSPYLDKDKRFILLVEEP